MRLKTFLLSSLLTILSYRVVSYLLIFFLGSSPFWHSIYSDPWNHYQLGALIIIFFLLVPHTSKISKYRVPFLGIGMGMIIDEISDIIKLFHLYPLPLDFRDSPGDLLVIFVMYIIFAFVIIISSRYLRQYG